MSVELNEVQKCLIDKIAKENGFNNYELKTNKGSEKGDNFLGILTTVTIKNGKDKLDLILKSAHQNEAFRKAAPLRSAYLREIYLYENVFNEFKKYQENHNVADIFDNYAKIYGSSIVEESECLILENLKTQGYQLWNKQQPMNSEHISAVLQGYAKFHGTSMAMKHKNPELYENITEDISSSIWENDEFVANKDKFDSFFRTVMNIGYKSIEDDPALTEFLKILEPQFSDMFSDGLKDPEYKTSIVHGDCWCNNLLFKYEGSDNKRPLDVKYIDWQISHVNSPAYDFCYFFLAHSPKEILDDYKTYLKLYYDTFSKHLRSLNCDPDEIFPFSRFEKHINRFMIFGLYMCFTILKIMLCDSEEAPDFGEMAEDGDMLQSMNFKFKNFDIFKERIRNLVVFVKDNNFISK
ncbi:unnamed protein product [Psylliodes chrysocephalus]|uniref:CHK kinase-like domain-containing protein n=1 Tax=Psylliodes chrysocephalus TaxID=3402493 RepID=A0A9P0CNM3_9CUCU|nr:unnamed protein product [Psylliodes chrysocephala]